MDETIIVRFKWTADELLTAQRLHLRHSRSGRARRVMRICAIISMPVSIAIMFLTGFGWTGVCLVFLGIVLLGTPWLTRRSTIKHFAKRPDRDMDLEWQILHDRLIAKTVMSNAEFNWSMIFSVLRTPAGFLLYPNDKIFHWLPAHGFREPADMERLAQMAQSKVQQYDNAA